MSGYAELNRLGVVFRPPSKPLPEPQNQSSPFRGSWSDTVSLLAKELRALRAERIAVELALSEGDLRIDGLPRANARLSSDSVRIAFDSIHGPLMYETGRYTRAYWRGNLDGWQVNLRAIALGLEALRKVERYGITKRGEQYTGWKQLPASTDPADAIQGEVTARRIILSAAGVREEDQDAAFDMAALAKLAVKAVHPDRGGDETEFRKVQRARDILGV